MKNLKEKPEIIAIACVSENLGIGNNGKLLYSIPDDMKYFREKTAGGTVIMGRKTLDSFPGKKPLKGRVNIVLTRDSGFFREGVITYNDFGKLRSDIENGKFGTNAVYIIGGGEIYKLFLPITDILLLTEVKQIVKSDSYFPEYSNYFIKTKQSDSKIYGDLVYTFNVYVRKGATD
jgi:dihydrofolate reductase